MGEGAQQAELIILRRILSYARKVLRWEERLDEVRDGRQQPRIPTASIVRSVVVMFLARLGSLNALEQSSPSRFWRQWLGRVMPSADTIGRVSARMECEDVRQVQHHVYSRLKRMKVLQPLVGNLMSAALDAHESHATYRRCCPGCLQRIVHTQDGDRVQYYHRHVTIELIAWDVVLRLDAEPIRPGEGEVDAAIRLLDRVLKTYPRAFDVVLGDGLYANSTFFNFVLAHGKHAVAVLKDENRDLWKDAESLFAEMSPTVVSEGRRSCARWDIEGFTTWPQVRQAVRVVRSCEQWTVQRQLDGQQECMHSNWTWVTTLPKALASTNVLTGLGHARWKIENEGFNELANHQHADHVYRHEPQAMQVFLLLAMLCLNVFEVFYRRNLKPQVRRTGSMLHFARQIAAELYAEFPSGPARAPT